MTKQAQDLNLSVPEMNFSGLAEETLVGLAQQGNDKAFEELVKRIWESCLSIATTILRDRADAQDEVQNAFWKAYTHLSCFDQESKFSTWVTRIVINHCLMKYRRAHRIIFVSYDASSATGETYIAHEPRDKNTPEQDFSGSEVSQLLRKEIACIPIRLRIPLEMRYLKELSFEDMAERLGITVSATKSRLHRAQTYLKDRMLRHCGKRGPATLMRAA
jgi:RNA polymerase sigma-70 factor (ECF subfamily)